MVYEKGKREMEGNAIRSTWVVAWGVKNYANRRCGSGGQIEKKYYIYAEGGMDFRVRA